MGGVKVNCQKMQNNKDKMQSGHKHEADQHIAQKFPEMDTIYEKSMYTNRSSHS